MQMKIQLSASELADILANHLDAVAIQYNVGPENITELIADCDPDGELNSLSVCLDFGEEDEPHFESDEEV